MQSFLVNQLSGLSAELVHCVFRIITSFQCIVTSEDFFVVVTDVRTSHCLVFHTSDTAADFFTLYASNISQHTFRTEVTLSKLVSRKSSCVVSRQSDQVVEHACFTRSVCLECTYFFVSFSSQFRIVILSAHQFSAVVCRYVFTFSNPTVVRLLTEVQCPVE